jgi:hypothetical protein
MVNGEENARRAMGLFFFLWPGWLLMRNDDSFRALFGKRFSILCCQIKVMMGKSSNSQKIVYYLNGDKSEISGFAQK